MRSLILIVAGVMFMGALSGCKEKNKEPVSTAPDYSTDDQPVMDAGAYSTDGGADSGAGNSGDTTNYTTYPNTYESPAAADSSGQTLPPEGYSSGSGRMHTVQKGDTLFRLARQYYNSQSRWKDIYEANRDQIPDPNRLKVGQTLVIP